METVMKLRRQILVDGKSIRAVSRETGLSRNTLRKYLKDDNPPSYNRISPPPKRCLKDFEEVLREWYDYDLKRAKRERRTAKRLYEQLLLEGYQGSYSPVCRIIKQFKQDQDTTHDAFIPLYFEAGDALQFDWSEEVVVLGGIERRIKVAHFRLCHSRKPFIVAYPRETQEMLLDAFVQAFAFYQGLPRRILIDNPKTMVIRIGSGKARDFHPRFMSLMNHYVVEPVACTPAAGWEKGQVESQVGTLRDQLFKPQLRFDDLSALNTYLLACCHSQGGKPHPQEKDQTIDQVFESEQPSLRALGRPFDGYIERETKVSSTCLVRYDNNHYSVPSSYAKQRISLRAYAHRIVLVANQQVIATHERSFNRHEYRFEPWHYVPILKRKPGALRNGAPFAQWALPDALLQMKTLYLKRMGGDREFVDLLYLIQDYDMDTVTTACELALEDKTTQLAAVINLIHRLTEPDIDPLPVSQHYPQLEVAPEADCQRYEQLRQQEASL